MPPYAISSGVAYRVGSAGRVSGIHSWFPLGATSNPRPGVARSQATNARASAAHHDQPVGTRLGAPHLAASSEELPHIRTRAEGHAREPPRRRDEPPETASPEVG